MAAPATTGVKVTSLSNMNVGDYIICEYVETTSGTVGSFSNLGKSTATEIAVSGSATPNGSFYFVKADKGLIIADRVIQHSITWDTLNSGNFIQRKLQTFTGALDGTTDATGLIRSLTGGVAYVDANGNKSTSDAGLGAWPTNNEWDKYVVNFPVDKIASGATLDDVFHWSSVGTFTQDTPVIEMFGSTNRIIRGNTSDNRLIIDGSGGSGIGYAFRPVFQYNE